MRKAGVSQAEKFRIGMKQAWIVLRDSIFRWTVQEAKRLMRIDLGLPGDGLFSLGVRENAKKIREPRISGLHKNRE
jgi:hypothetical protein